MRKLFLVGCPRSGTTWLQIILGSHSHVATVRETHLFHWYVTGLYAQWQAEERHVSKDGLRILLTPADFDLACRQFADVVFDKIETWNPGAEILLEKTPDHLKSWRIIRRLYPDALFLHLVRDPRAVACSLLAFGRETWGQGAPRDVTEAALFWRTNVRIGRDELPQLGTNYLEVRYEDLSSRPDEVLGRICSWLAIPPLRYDPERFSIEQLRTRRTVGEPALPSWEDRENFFRRGAPDGWQTELSPDQIETVELLCDDLMKDFGYAPHEPAGARH